MNNNSSEKNELTYIKLIASIAWIIDFVKRVSATFNHCDLCTKIVCSFKSTESDDNTRSG